MVCTRAMISSLILLWLENIFGMFSTVLSFRSKMPPKSHLLGARLDCGGAELHGVFSSWMCYGEVGFGWRQSLGGWWRTCILAFGSSLLSASRLPWGEQLPSTRSFCHGVPGPEPTGHGLNPPETVSWINLSSLQSRRLRCPSNRKVMKTLVFAAVCFMGHLSCDNFYKRLMDTCEDHVFCTLEAWYSYMPIRLTSVVMFAHLVCVYWCWSSLKSLCIIVGLSTFLFSWWIFIFYNLSLFINHNFRILCFWYIKMYVIINISLF